MTLKTKLISDKLSETHLVTLIFKSRMLFLAVVRKNHRNDGACKGPELPLLTLKTKERCQQWRNVGCLQEKNTVWGASLVAQIVRNLPAMQKTWIWSLGQEEPLENGMATHSSILAWRMPWRRLAACSPWGHKESNTPE